MLVLSEIAHWMAFTNEFVLFPDYSLHLIGLAAASELAIDNLHILDQKKN
jgi:hypothetical protein